MIHFNTLFSYKHTVKLRCLRTMYVYKNQIHIILVVQCYFSINACGSAMSVSRKTRTKISIHIKTRLNTTGNIGLYILFITLRYQGITNIMSIHSRLFMRNSFITTSTEIMGLSNSNKYNTIQ